MASLSTVYAISLVLTSIAGMGSAFVGNKIYPIKGGAETPPPTPEEVKKATADAAEKARLLAEAEVYKTKQAEPEPVPEPPLEPSAPPAPEPEPAPEPAPEPEPTAPEEDISKPDVSPTGSIEEDPTQSGSGTR